jgi:hypothetical protein
MGLYEENNQSCLIRWLTFKVKMDDWINDLAGERNKMFPKL